MRQLRVGVDGFTQGHQDEGLGLAGQLCSLEQFSRLHFLICKTRVEWASGGKTSRIRELTRAPILLGVP